MVPTTQETRDAAVQCGFFTAASVSATLSLITCGLDGGLGLYTASAIIGLSAGSGVATGLGAKPSEAFAAGFFGTVAGITLFSFHMETLVAAGTAVSATAVHTVAEGATRECSKSERNRY